MFFVCGCHRFDVWRDTAYFADMDLKVNLKPDASGEVKEQTVMFRDSPEALPKSCSHRIHGTGIFTHIYHKNQLNVGKYSLLGSYGVCFYFFFLGCADRDEQSWAAWMTIIHIIPAKWQANEQLGAGDSHQPVLLCVYPGSPVSTKQFVAGL